MKNGRVETYVHSDNVTENKGAAVVCVRIKTDFAAKTDQFIGYCKRLAQMAYAASFAWEAEPIGTTITPIFVIESEFPEIKQEREMVEKELKEPIVIERIEVIKL